MPIHPSQTEYYRRARFTTRLPRRYQYAPSHYWMLEVEPGLIRIGLTQFATRMLGEFVERDLQVAPGDSVEVGQVLGWMEGFKALSDIYCVALGEFAGGNTELDNHPEWVDGDCYDRGWLYLVRGRCGPGSLDCQGYISLLDATIDRMLAQQQQESKPC